MTDLREEIQGRKTGMCNNPKYGVILDYTDKRHQKGWKRLLWFEGSEEATCCRQQEQSGWQGPVCRDDYTSHN